MSAQNNFKKPVFTKSVMGYTPREVDQYIEYMNEQYAAATRDIAELRRRLTRYQLGLDPVEKQPAAEDDEKILFYDTKHVAIGQCAAVIRFAKELKEHPDWTPEQVMEAAERISKSVRMCFTPSNLDYLRAGGRVSNATALCGNILGIHPKIELLDGYLKATKKYRGKMNKVVLKLLNDYVNEEHLDRKEIWLGNSPGFPEELKAEVIEEAKKLGFEEIHWTKTGGVITSHGGSNAFCMAGYCVEEG